MKSKPWHSLVDEMIAERAMTVQEVYNALEAYYFTPVYDPRTRRSVLRRGRAWFPPLQQVKGYLTHSGKFSQTGHGTAWRLKGVHLKAEQFALEEVDGRYYNNAGYELRPIVWETGTGYRDEIYPSGNQFRTYEEALEDVRRIERKQYQESLEKMLSSGKIYVFDITYGASALDGLTENQLRNRGYWYPGEIYVGNGEYEERPIPEPPEELFLEMDRNMLEQLNELDALLSAGVDAEITRPNRYTREDETINVYDSIVKIDSFGSGDGETFYWGGYYGSELKDRYGEPDSLDLQPPLDEIIEIVTSNLDERISKLIARRTSYQPIDFEYDIIDNAVMFEFNPLFYKTHNNAYEGSLEHQTAPQTWQERFDTLSYLASEAWDPLTDPNQNGDTININTGQGYQEMMLYGGCAGPSATYFTWPSLGNYPTWLMPSILME
tara:strand:- start:502 stop:1812 length:1311 start_codon:yes stop_codon:yes gene_type:complete